MMIVDPVQLIDIRRQELLAQAEMERLAAEVRRPPSAARRELALVCYRLADWLDAPSRYLRASESGAEDWVAPMANL